MKKIKIGNDAAIVGKNAFLRCGAFFEVDGDNEYLKSADGVLYSKDMTELIKYPGLKGGSYYVPDSVSSIREDAFVDCEKLKELNLGGGITEFPLDGLEGACVWKRCAFPKIWCRLAKHFMDAIFLA